jgi:hypothetical protein
MFFKINYTDICNVIYWLVDNKNKGMVLSWIVPFFYFCFFKIIKSCKGLSQSPNCHVITPPNNQ